ncbi:helix-turn-helix domain-containing protein [Rhizobium mongolense]|uniref:Helix-turn-helix protein n=1 Tax=Rhizobium mongolense TaxID=57676 RepID=A0A7W6RQZ6_9HYPH|nr:helix-turn-helix transcriptional regulator [Rhizobium mongolense]MBB4277017.1 hypothetical protein [Rhizobium mongolense]
MHYQRWRYHGSVHGSANTKKSEALAFLRDVAMKVEADVCLIWPYAHNKDRPVVTIDGKSIYVRVAVCEAVHGPSPSARQTPDSVCKNPKCVSKRHLFWKQIHTGGSMTKVDGSDRRQIRKLSKTKTQTEIAEWFGLDHSTVSRILNGKRR